jgi:endonuclease/exonuclease/phosphatase family metal-dependent hydrolase
MVSADDTRLARATLAVALLLVTLTYAVTRVFVLNFSTAGPNATALLALSLVTGWTLPVAVRVDAARRDPVLVALAAVGVAGSLLGGPVVALVGAALVGIALTPMLAVDAARLGARVGVAVGVGSLLVLAVRSLNGAVAAYATLPGTVGLVALLVALAATTAGLGRADDGGPVTALPRLAPLFAAVFLAALWLGFPTVSARWAGRPYLAAVALAALGLLAGAGGVATYGAPGRRGALVWGGVLVASLAALLTASTVALAALLPATAALVVLAAVGGRGATTPRRAGLAVVATQLVGLVLVVTFVLAVNWAFVPGVGPLVRGLEPVTVTALGVLVAVTAALAAGDVASTAPPAPDATRRTLVGGIGGALLAVVGALARAPRPDDASTPDDLHVATYNLHQFLDANGDYNLESVAATLRDQEAGIVGLQETEGARITSGNVYGVRWLAEALGYHYHPGPDTETGGYGVALLSAWPIQDVQVVELPTDGTVTRPAVRAVVAHPDGAIPVVVAHLEVAGAVRARQAERVVGLVDGEPRAVVVGDFNATPDEAVVDVMTDHFTDAWAAVGEGDGDTYSAGRPRRRIDYVFVRGFEPTDATVFGGPGESDHRGVRATLDRA